MVEYEFRRIEPLRARALDAGTTVIDLPLNGGITKLDIVAKMTNDAGGNLTNPLRAIILGIKVVTGTGKVLCDCSATELIALATLRDQIAPLTYEVDTASLIQFVHIPILFGRVNNDQQIGLDLNRAKGLKLEIKYNAALVRACGANGFVSGTFSLAVDAHITRDGAPPAYSACIVPFKTVDQKATTVTEERIPMRFSVPLVCCMLYAYRSGYISDTLVSEVQLMELGNQARYVQALFSSLQNDRPLLTGAVVDNYAMVYVAPGRFGDVALMTFGQTGAELKIKMLATSGVYSVLGEVLTTI
jgi:hypothetical protein